MIPADAAKLLEEAFGGDEPPPENAEELLVEAMECLQAISTRSIQAAQDDTLTETDLRALLEDICMDAGTVITDATTLVDAGKCVWPEKN